MKENNQACEPVQLDSERLGFLQRGLRRQITHTAAECCWVDGFASIFTTNSEVDTENEEVGPIIEVDWYEGRREVNVMREPETPGEMNLMLSAMQRQIAEIYTSYQEGYAAVARLVELYKQTELGFVLPEQIDEVEAFIAGQRDFEAKASMEKASEQLAETGIEAPEIANLWKDLAFIGCDSTYHYQEDAPFFSSNLYKKKGTINGWTLSRNDSPGGEVFIKGNTKVTIWTHKPYYFDEIPLGKEAESIVDVYIELDDKKEGIRFNLPDQTQIDQPYRGRIYDMRVDMLEPSYEQNTRIFTDDDCVAAMQILTEVIPDAYDIRTQAIRESMAE